MTVRYIFLSSLVFLFGCQSTSSGLVNYSATSAEDRARIESIFDIFDQQMKGSDEYLEYIDDDVILMAPNVDEIRGRENYIQHIQDNRSYGETEIEHKLIELYSDRSIVIARGKAVGTFRAAKSQENMAFETKNVFIFRRLENNDLKVWQIIFNMSP